jgi:hypothetical protein
MLTKFLMFKKPLKPLCSQCIFLNLFSLKKRHYANFGHFFCPFLKTTNTFALFLVEFLHRLTPFKTQNIIYFLKHNQIHIISRCEKRDHKPNQAPPKKANL